MSWDIYDLIQAIDDELADHLSPQERLALENHIVMRAVDIGQRRTVEEFQQHIDRVDFRHSRPL